MIERLRRLARSCIARALYHSGVLWLIARSRLRQSGIVLMYHRVLPARADTFSSGAIVVTPETFARHLRFLKKHFRLLSMRDLAVAFAERRPLPPMSCVITFDDGWFDNHRYALPVLREHGVPAVVFAATDFIGSDRCFWQERLARMLYLAAGSAGETARLAAQYLGADFGSRSEADRRALALEAVARLKPRGLQAIARIEAELRAALSDAGIEPGLGDDRFMSWQELTALANDPNVTVGSHGCSHVPLTSVEPDVADGELQRARARLEAELGRTVDTVGYPNGDYDDTVIGLARGARYRLGFTTDKGTISVTDDPLRLRRVNIGEANTRSSADFLCAMLLIFHRFRRPVPTPPPVHAHPGH
jgi:peptidoglycan/xylan/chitin deacetylase (PgdA/CDA1 family)